MPKLWQINHARAMQTNGVWALEPGFVVRSKGIDDHEAHAADILAHATAAENADNVLDTMDAQLANEYQFFKSMNSAIYQRLDGEVPDDDPLQLDIDQIGGIRADNRAKIDDRTLRTVSAWEKANAVLAAMVPARPAVVVRGVTAAQYKTRWETLASLKLAREGAAGVWRTTTSELRTAARSLDQLNKAWYQAWKSEYPPGTPQGDALAGVSTEQGQPMPQILEIAAITREGSSLRVTYVAGTGKHATVLDLLYQVDGVHADYQRVTVDIAGNLIGPFAAGQTVKIRTDVGNSRDYSEMSPEQAIVVA